eukprot:s129_g42.t1
MKLGKAPGDDGLTTEMLKWAPPSLLEQLFTFTQSMWDQTCNAQPDALTRHWPDEWLTATVIPLWKRKHPKSNKNNWRGVTLLSVGVKLIARIVAGRVQQLSETFMDEEQQGFRHNRGVDDILQVSRRITEEVCSSRAHTNIKLTLYDIEKAYPRINREALWILLRKRGFPQPFIQLCQALHDFTQFHIRLDGVTSTTYEADRGLKEGCPSSPPLFNVYHQAVLHDYRTRRKRAAEEAGLTPGIPWKTFVDGRLSRRRSGFLASTNRKEHVFGDLEFADDTATVATETEFPQADRILETTFTDWGEKLNRAKTETLLLKPKTPPEPRRTPPQQHTSVRHVGGILSETASQWKDTMHRSIQGRIRAKQIAKAWSTGTHRGRGQSSCVKLLARLRVMRSILIPTLTTFGRTRSWSKAQIGALQTVQNYALQRVFGLDRLAMHELHITNQQLHNASLWPPVRVILMRQTMRWFGHVCRMPIDRLPKLALFGTWAENTSRPIQSMTQIRWLHEILAAADIHHLDFFRLAQNLDHTKWDRLVNKAFPINRLTTRAARTLNHWRPGQALPDNTLIRRRQQRTTWHNPASRVPHNACPVCLTQFNKLQALQHHYLQTHAVTDPAITTFSTFQCGECRQTFTTQYARVNHECRILYTVPDADNTDIFGWKPFHPPQPNPLPAAWKIYTDGSFHPDQPQTAGWGAAVYDIADASDTTCLAELFAPVCLDKEDQRFLGAQQASNNTGELSAIAETLIWLRDECPGPTHTPAEMIYDSHYAANLTLGSATPHANQQLAQTCHFLYLEVSRIRPLSFRWVKGHSNTPGNDKADALAEQGRSSQVCTHSRRWAAPKKGALTVATAANVVASTAAPANARRTNGPAQAPQTLTLVPTLTHTHVGSAKKNLDQGNTETHTS